MSTLVWVLQKEGSLERDKGPLLLLTSRPSAWVPSLLHEGEAVAAVHISNYSLEAHGSECPVHSLNTMGKRLYSSCVCTLCG